MIVVNTILKIPRSFKIFYLFFGLSCLGLTLRIFWAMPNVTMLTQFSNIDEVISAYEARWSEVAVLDFGTGHATNGYRFIQILNAKIFGLNSRVELVLYYLVIFCLAILCLEWWRKRAAEIQKNPWPISILIVSILSSFVSASSGGMEIGTFIGLAAQLGVFSFAIRPKRSVLKHFDVIAISTVQFLTVFFWLGPYSVPFAFAWTAVYISAKFGYSKFVSTQKNLLVGAISIFVSAAVWSIGVVWTSQPATWAGSLSGQVRDSPTYPFRYLLRMFPAGLISDKTFEGLGSQFTYILIYGSSTFLFFLLLIGLTKSIKSRDVPSLPIFLISHGVFLAMTLLVNRPFGSNWLLSTWYGPQFKLLLCGVILLWAGSTTKPSKWWIIPSYLPTFLVFVTLFCTLLFANFRQWERHPHERAYFQAIQSATINPNLLSLDGAGRTQLLLPMGESIRVIKLLDKYHLGVFNTGKKMIAIDPSGISISGDVWSDNWIGKKVTITIGPQCEEVDLHFTSNAYNPVVNIQISSGNLRNVVVSSDSPVRIKIGSESYQTNRTIKIVASPVWNPKSQGINGDLRELSVTMQSLCSRIESGPLK